MPPENESFADVCLHVNYKLFFINKHSNETYQEPY